MSDLFQLSPKLRERIVAKFDWKSYFRLQQTCKSMEEFIRTSSDVKVSLPEKYCLEIRPDGERWGEPVYELMCNDKGMPVDFDSLYGVRFNRIHFGGGIHVPPGFMPNLCTILKKYRISAHSVNTYVLRDFENYDQFLKLVKPVDIVVTSYENDLFETVIKAKEPKKVNVRLLPNDLIDFRVLKNSLEKLQELEVNVDVDEIPSSLSMISGTLECLRSQPLPYLRLFLLKGCVKDIFTPLPPLDELTALFNQFNLNFINTFHDHSSLFGHLFEGGLGLDGSFCRVKIFKPYIEVLFLFAEDQ